MAENKKMWSSRLKAMRKRENLSRIDFAVEYLKVSARHYGAMEEGRSAPSNYIKYKMEKLS